MSRKKYFNSLLASLDERLKLSDIDMNIVFDGDSLTAGVPVGGQYYPNQVKNWLQTRCKSLTFNSFGVSGQSTLDMLSDIGTQILPLYDSNKENVIVAWEDVNAILNDGRTAQQNYDDFDNYFTQCKNVGFKTILLTGYYPRTPYNQVSWNNTTPTRLSKQKDYFDLVLNSPLNSVDVHIDLRDTVNIGGAEAQAVNPTYFDDSVHLEAAGYDEVANDVINKGILSLYTI